MFITATRQILFTNVTFFTLRNLLTPNFTRYIYSRTHCLSVSCKVSDQFLPERGKNQGKTSSKYYLRIMNPLNVNLHKWTQLTFQKVSVSAHKAETTQQWSKNIVPDFRENKDWASSSPDLNPQDYKLWPILEAKVLQIWQPNLKNHKHSFKERSNWNSHASSECLGGWLAKVILSLCDVKRWCYISRWNEI